MDITIYPNALNGTVEAIPSKSQAHRLLICAAFADKATFLSCPQTNDDIEATANCLNAMGAQITYRDAGYHIIPISAIPSETSMDCGESGSTLRFLLPIVCALGIHSTFHLHGRLPYRPLSPLWEELERMGCTLTRPTETTIATSGKLIAGTFHIRGDVSSQYITGLLFAAALMDGESSIQILGNLESRPYVDMTQNALNDFGVNTDNFKVKGGFPFASPGILCVEGDWSNAAFFLGAQALGHHINVTNLNANSPQGDRAISSLLQFTQQMPTISAANIPDLVPILAVVYGAKCGATFTNIARLRLKESDRVASICNMLNAFGATATATEDTLTVYPSQYHGCTIDAVCDHRIAMAAAIGASVADGPVKILGAQCVAKSYPSFWEIYKNLGGHYEQHLR